MAKKGNGRNGTLANPTKVKPFRKKDDLVRVIVETPKGCRNKYAFDPINEIFTLKKVLPTGMSFPYDFGFVPQTRADDGDPVDVLILMEESAFPGCMINCRLVGVIEGEQQQDGKKERNDRILAVESGSHMYAQINTVDDIPEKLIDEIGEFFVNYHKLEGHKFRVLAIKGPDQARRLIDSGLVAA